MNVTKSSKSSTPSKLKSKKKRRILVSKLNSSPSSYTFVGRPLSPPFVFSSNVPTLTNSNMRWLVTGDIDEGLYLREEDFTRYTRSENKVWDLTGCLRGINCRHEGRDLGAKTQGRTRKRKKWEESREGKEVIDLTSA